MTLPFGQSLRVNILKRGSGLPMHSFIDVSVLEQRLQIFQNFQKFISILLLTICQDLSKTFLFIYFFVILISLFQSSNILSQEDILSQIC